MCVRIQMIIGEDWNINRLLGPSIENCAHLTQAHRLNCRSTTARQLRIDETESAFIHTLVIIS